jgi:hypothetical protein
MKIVYVYKGPLADHFISMEDADAATAEADDWGQDASAWGAETQWKAALHGADVPPSYNTWYETVTGTTVDGIPLKAPPDPAPKSKSAT